jgi:type II secretory pathway component PulK
VDEIGQVLGMTPDLLARLRPYLSVFQQGDAQLTAGSSTSRSAIQDAQVIAGRSPLIGFVSTDQVVDIRAMAVLRDGTRYARHAIVQLSGHARQGEAAWRLLRWD